MKYALLLIIAILAITSCSDQCTGKQVTCPAFDKADFEVWFPYSQNQQLIFTSVSTVDTFLINQVYSSASYQETVTAGNSFCIAEARFASAPDSLNVSLLNAFFRISNNEFTNETRKESAVNIGGTFFYGHGFSDTGMIKESFDVFVSHYYNSVNVGNRAYNNVQEVSIDTTQRAFKSTEIYKFWLAKNVGIIGYEEFHGKLYAKQ